jgi:hypothetical protein
MNFAFPIRKDDLMLVYGCIGHIACTCYQKISAD